MTDIVVHVHQGGNSTIAGTAHFTRERRGVTTTFTYDSAYLRGRDNTPIDPGLQLFSGNQYLQRLPGAFSDSAPDRWGRNLLARRERQLAAEEGRRARSLDEVDFLLGVNDETRQGALRYSRPGSDEMLSPRTDVPRLVALPELLRASDEVAADGEDATAYKKLLAAGTASLGGARPKAAVQLADGTLGIAKFPHSGDRRDVMAWECIALDIAENAGISAPGRSLVKVGERHVLLLSRFDRSGPVAEAQRIGYISAMTMLEEVDGASGDYVEIAEHLRDLSAALREDHRELFDRVVLSIALHNTDDHLRNHGFLAAPGGWRFSPVFDVNPNPDLAEDRSTSIAGATGSDEEAAGLAELASTMRISGDEAKARVGKVLSAVEQWRGLAQRYGVPESEQKLVGRAIDDRVACLREHISGR
ncbi:type II toxin-antitoxin system HipA family toxin [Microbacterium sp. ARD32]|uniref:type II toxin-antitoxin system HipA family toxin n=1 Tax=Microbacterium sp. ARD32 TaxID=2962577 RepID=UPI002880D4D9|nr:type II toxin-antitoxin system HipA family toxin [Microbacterium sp. ARD32]MDT0156185.1 type II toxin-antitoxin system HipA family toxin [Microbacterium sp. ARD32]